MSYCVDISSYLGAVSWDKVLLAFYGGTVLGAMFLASKSMFFRHIAWHRLNLFVSESRGGSQY